MGTEHFLDVEIREALAANLGMKGWLAQEDGGANSSIIVLADAIPSSAELIIPPAYPEPSPTG